MTLASTLLAALPPALRHPLPRQSEAAREFDTLLDALHRAEWPADPSLHNSDMTVTHVAFDGPAHAVRRRARH